MNRIASFLFLFALVFAPLAFGTVEHWSLASLEIITAIAFAVLFLGVWLGKRQSQRVVGLIPLLLLYGFLLFQLLPLPPFLLKLLSPGSYDIYAPLLEVSKHQKWLPISVQPKETLHELLRLLSYGLVYVLTIQLLSAPGFLKKTIHFIVYLAAAIAMLAIVQEVSSPDKIYWFRKIPESANGFGPWISPNQFSGFMELLFPFGLALFLFYKPRVRSDEPLKERVISFFAEPRIHQHLIFGLVAVVIGMSVFISLCRGGILSLLAGVFVFILLYNLKFPRRSRGTFLLVVLCSFIVVSWFGWDKIWAEFNYAFDESGRFRDGRLALWSDTWLIIKDFPLLGAGFGSFLALFPMYRTISGDIVYQHAHNDYLELLTDGGLVSFLLIAWFLVAILFHGWKMVKVRRDQFAVLMGIASLSGLLSLLIHSLADFNLHNGAVGFYFFFVAGILVASVNCRFNYFSSESLLPTQSAKEQAAFAIGGLSIALFISLMQVGSFLAGSYYNTIQAIYISPQLNLRKLLEIEEKMVKAVKADPLEGLYNYKLGAVKIYQGAKEEGYRQHLLAALKNPLEGVFLQQVGLLSEDKQGRSLIAEGYHRAIMKKVLLPHYIEYLLWRGARAEAFAVLRNRLEQNYHELGNWMGLLNSFGVSLEEFSSILPEEPMAWLDFGFWWETHNRPDNAEYFYTAGLEQLEDVNESTQQWLLEVVIRFFLKNDRQLMALYTMRKGVEFYPESVNFRLWLGDYYLKEGITYRAKEEYEQILVTHPGNAKARSRLRRMGFADSY